MSVLTTLSGLSPSFQDLILALPLIETGRASSVHSCPSCSRPSGVHSAGDLGLFLLRPRS